MNDSYENRWIEHYFNIVREYFSDTIYAKLISDTFNMYKWNNKPPFIFCLSANKDLLSQWRAYSHDGQGVSVGFNTKKVNIKNELPSPNVYAHNTLGIEKVMYYNHSQKIKVTELCKDVKKSFDKNPTSEENFLLSIGMAFSLMNWALIFKNPSFKEEREWRIIHTPNDSYELPLKQLSELKFRFNSNKITTYFSYNFEEMFNSDLIPEIVIGPKCKMKKEEIEQFLRHNNLGKTKVVMSKSTYR